LTLAEVFFTVPVVEVLVLVVAFLRTVFLLILSLFLGE